MRNSLSPTSPLFFSKAFSGGDDFTPLGVTGLLAWYDPSDLSTLWQDAAGTVPVTSDGDPVRRIDDKGPNNHNLVAPNDSSRPVYKTLGGLHWIESDGVDDIMSISSRFGLGGNPTMEVSLSVRVLANVGSVDRFWHLGGDSSGVIGGSGGTLGYSYRHNNGNKVFGAVTLDTDVVVRWDRESGDNYGEQKFFLDKVQQSQTSSGSPTNSPYNTTANFCLFNAPSVANAAQIRMYGCVISSGTSDLNIGNFETYLAKKQGRVL